MHCIGYNNEGGDWTQQAYKWFILYKIKQVIVEFLSTYVCPMDSSVRIIGYHKMELLPSYCYIAK